MAAKKRQFLAMKTSQGTPAVYTAAATSELPSSSSRTPSKLSLLVTFLCICVANGFAPAPPLRTAAATLHMSYYDMSDYSSGPADYDDDSEVGESAYAGMRDAAEKAAAESEASEVKLEQPPPLSKNAGNAFIALVFDKALDAHGRAWDDLVEDRIVDTGKHVRWCREANLYNETVNTDSLVDVRKSYQVLSSCATRPIGHVLILESADLAHIKSFLATDPVVQKLGCSVEDIPLYRWRHIKDYTLRMDDGRDGYPNVLIQMDRPAEELGGTDIRSATEEAKLEYMIRSRKVIAAGPLHLPTEIKDDPSSMPVGDIVFFNAMDRDGAVEFAENDPAALAGLYETMRVHKYNTLDITGKFISENLHTLEGNDDIVNRHLILKEEMRAEGYPVDDEQTSWFNY